jgi:HEPN domain-containing protein
MCQQALEKLAKGLYIYFVGDEAPRVHIISYILTEVTDRLNIRVDEDIFTLLDKLSAYYLQGRYPTYKEKYLSWLIKRKLWKF